MPAVKRAQELYGPRGFVVIGFNADRDRQKMTDYLTKNGYGGWSHYWMSTRRNAMQARYWVSGYPTNFLVGRDGKIITRSIRFVRGAGTEAIEAALAAPDPTTPEKK